VSEARGWIDQLSPVAFHFFVPGIGDIAIRWYGLAYVVGFEVGYYLLQRLRRHGRLALTKEQVGAFVASSIFGVMLGGRLGYAVFYAPHLFITFTSRFPFWELLAINHGGMASHGGMIGLVLACLWFAHRHRISPLALSDSLALTGTPGLFFGRLANFVNGELYGRPAPSWLPWAVRFPHELPSQRTGPGLTPRHPSQIYEALLEGLLLFVVLNVFARKPRRVGVSTAWFLILYAVVRFIGEFFREPDAQVGLQWLGLTRGQWLSAIMLAGGVALRLVLDRSQRHSEPAPRS
jgi:phosphatidylglycerol:prolipoprotein diacylglycerol transferase